MKKATIVLGLFAGLLIWTCTYDTVHDIDAIDHLLQQNIQNASPTRTLDHFILPGDNALDEIPQDPRNPLTPQKVALGQFLFFETGLAQDAVRPSGIGTYSCASCHLPTAAFRPGRIQGIADGGMGIGSNGEKRLQNPEYDEYELDAQGVRPLSLLNVAYVTNTLWNGQFGGGDINTGTEAYWNAEDGTLVNHLGYSGIESQNIEGLVLHRMRMTDSLAVAYGYKDLYDVSFPEVPRSERYTNITTALAISAYIRTIIPSDAPFQAWLKGDHQAMNTQEKRGANLFFGKANCASCHNSPGLNAMKFYALGVRDLYEAGGLATSVEDKKNLGRGGFTGRAEDMFKFKVPQLYNLKDAPFFFHGSSKETLEEVVEYFDRAEPENTRVPASQIARKFRPLHLTDAEKQDLLAFLRHGLYDPNLMRYAPPYVKSGNCFPNNDPMSRADMGCE